MSQYKSNSLMDTIRQYTNAAYKGAVSAGLGLAILATSAAGNSVIQADPRNDHVVSHPFPARHALERLREKDNPYSALPKGMRTALQSKIAEHIKEYYTFVNSDAGDFQVAVMALSNAYVNRLLNPNRRWSEDDTFSMRVNADGEVTGGDFVRIYTGNHEARFLNANDVASLDANVEFVYSNGQTLSNTDLEKIKIPMNQIGGGYRTHVFKFPSSSDAWIAARQLESGTVEHNGRTLHGVDTTKFITQFLSQTVNFGNNKDKNRETIEEILTGLRNEGATDQQLNDMRTRLKKLLPESDGSVDGQGNETGSLPPPNCIPQPDDYRNASDDIKKNFINPFNKAIAESDETEASEIKDQYILFINREESCGNRNIKPLIDTPVEQNQYTRQLNEFNSALETLRTGIDSDKEPSADFRELALEYQAALNHGSVKDARNLRRRLLGMTTNQTLESCIESMYKTLHSTTKADISCLVPDANENELARIDATQEAEVEHRSVLRRRAQRTAVKIAVPVVLYAIHKLTEDDKPHHTTRTGGGEEEEEEGTTQNGTTRNGGVIFDQGTNTTAGEEQASGADYFGTQAVSDGMDAIR